MLIVWGLVCALFGAIGYHAWLTSDPDWSEMDATGDYDRYEPTKQERG